MLLAALLVAIAGLLFFIAVWIVLPGWTYPLLVLAVGSPEVSAWLFAASLLVGIAAAAIGLTSSRLLPIAFLLAIGAAALASIPLGRAPWTIRRFDAEMSRALGADFLNRVPASARNAMRPRAVVVADLFRGIDFGSPRIVNGITFASPEGQALKMTVYRPQAEGRFPIVVQVYGGSWQRGTPDDYPELARYLATRGYVIFAIDYRHAPRWTWPAPLDDVKTALGWIRMHASEYGGDVGRMAILGRSAGAHLAMLAAYQPEAPPIRGVVSFYGPTDLTEGYRHPPRPNPLDVRAIDEAFLAGTPDSVPDRYRDASPINYVLGRLPPTLLIYGTRDHIVEARFGRDLHDRLKATGTPSALLELPWSEHAFDVLPSGLGGQIALYYTERFLAAIIAQ